MPIRNKPRCARVGLGARNRTKEQIGFAGPKDPFFAFVDDGSFGGRYRYVGQSVAVEVTGGASTRTKLVVFSCSFQYEATLRVVCNGVVFDRGCRDLVRSKNDVASPRIAVRS